MKNNELGLYLAAMKHIKNMLDESIINEDDFLKAEEYLAKKHCIKDKSIYRLNNLITKPTYGINIGEEKETENEQNNDHRTVTRIF